MRMEYERDGWVKSEDFDALGHKFLDGELDLRGFVEAVYADYEKVRGKQPDIEGMIRDHENLPAIRALTRISFLVSMAQGLIRAAEPEPSKPKTLQELKRELCEARLKGEKEAMFVIALEILDLVDAKLAALEEANNHDPFRLIGKQG